MRALRTPFILLAAAVATLVACGDDDPGMTATEYRDAGNDICRHADAAVSAAIPEEEPTVELARTKLAPQLIEALSGIREELDSLSPPSSLERDHTQLLAAFDSATTALDQAIDDVALMEQVLAEGPPLDEIGALAARLGLTACTGHG